MMKPHAIMFHHFHDEHHPNGQGSISANQFEDLINYVGRQHNILTAEEWFHRADTGTLKDTEVCLTFDDNLRCQFDIALPVMEALGMTAFWFVYSSPLQGTVERLELYRYYRSTDFESVDQFYSSFDKFVSESTYSNIVSQGLEGFEPSAYLAEYPEYSSADRQFRFLRDQVLGPKAYFQLMDAMIAESNIEEHRMLDKLWMNEKCIRYLHTHRHIIGLHSHTHPTQMTGLNIREQEKEYRTNYNQITKILGSPVLAMSHPCNSYSDETLTILNDLGIRVGFRASMDDGGGSKLECPRDDHTYVMSRMTLSSS